MPPTMAHKVTTMELKHIKGIGPAKQQKLKDAGISSVEELAKADIAKLVEATGMSEAALKEYKGKAVGLTLINDLKGITPETVKTLAMSGIDSLKELYEASAERIAAEAKVAKENVEKWQQEAKDLANRVAEDAKTPEGRTKLRHEAVELAEKTVQKTRDVAVELYHKVQHDGEVAIAKAKEIQEKAPEMLKEYREKAEAALKEAEARVKELQEKAPQQAKDVGAKAQAAVEDAQKKVAELKDKIEQVTKTEVEKFKAANEGFFGRIKARFNKKNA